MMNTKVYNAKILLFGEHTVIIGSQALAIPLNSFNGYWKYEKHADQAALLQQNLAQFIQYLREQQLQEVLNVTKFEEALKKGLYFESNIPTGYGLGSSGALCAAVYDTFGKKPNHESPEQLKQLFGKMESFFHGSSSGFDPLVSYLNYPVLVDEGIKKAQLPGHTTQGQEGIFLLDTGLTRDASNIINEFMHRYQSDFFQKKCQADLIPAVDEAIQALLGDRWELLFSIFHEISLFQYRYFDFMIPEGFKNLWLTSLSSTHFKLKICGAGGGGFMLGISNDFLKTREFLSDFKLIEVIPA